MTTPLADFLSLLVSLGVSGDKIGEVTAAAEAAFSRPARDSGSTPERREKWRAKQERYRARKAARSAMSTGGQTQTTIREEIPYTDLSLQKKIRKSDSGVSTPSPVDKPKRAKRSVGDPLPDDWKPTEDHYALGEKLGMAREYVDDLAKRMRDWAVANEHRAVARKAGVRGWNAAFSNWLKSHHERNGGSKNEANRNGPRRGFSGIAARVRYGTGGAPPDERPAPENLQPVNRR